MGIVFSALVALTVVNAGFQEISDARPTGWELSGKWRVETSGGHNGGAGIVWESSEPSVRQDRVTQELHGWKAGDEFRFSALWKTVGFKSEQTTVRATVCIEYHDAKGKWLGGAYAGYAPLGDERPFRRTLAGGAGSRTRNRGGNTGNEKDQVTCR